MYRNGLRMMSPWREGWDIDKISVRNIKKEGCVLNGKIGNWTIKNKYLITYILYGTKIKEHTHDGVEIVYIANGHGEHIIDGQRYHVKPGSVVFIKKGQTHFFSAIDNFEYYNLLFDPAFLSEEFADCKSVSEIMNLLGYETSERVLLEMGKSKKAERILQLIFVEDINKEKNYRRLIRGYIEALLNYLARKSMEVREETRDKKYESIDDILAYIDENPEKRMTLEEVSGLFGYAPDYFSRVLKKKYNLTFKQLVLKKRIARAISYLMDTNESVENIAKKCGFTNITFFYEKFEEYVGLKPGQVRAYRDRYHEINKKMGEYLTEMNEITTQLLL